jgi:hypothetical protein
MPGLDGVIALGGEECTDGAPVTASPEECSRATETESPEKAHVGRWVSKVLKNGVAEPCAIEPGPLACDREEVAGDDRRYLLATDDFKLVNGEAGFPKDRRDAYVVVVAEFGVKPELG